MISQPKTRRDAAIGIDIGSTFAAISYCDGRAVRPVECPISGSQIPTVVFVDAETSKAYVGREALLQSYGGHDGYLVMHAKRSMATDANKPVYFGKITPKEVVTHILKYVYNLLLRTLPELAGYPQFGGSRKRKEQLGLIFTIPGTHGVAEQSPFREAILAAGFRSFDGFIPEENAAARHLANLNTVKLTDGAKIVVADVGGGTTDVGLLERRKGTFDQLRSSAGDGKLAGMNFTNAIAEPIANEYSVPWEGVFGDGGFMLSAVAREHREDTFACFEAAEEIKKNLSLVESTSVVLNLRSGRTVIKFERDKAKQLWQPLIERFKEAVSTAVSESSISPSEIDHAFLAGGSSLLPGLREAFADALGRPSSEVVMSPNSQHIVANGAAEHGFFQDDASKSLPSGFGLIVRDRATSNTRNWLMASPEEIIPPVGIFREREGFYINAGNGNSALVIKPFVCRNGVRAALVDGRNTFLEDSEIVPLKEVTAPIGELPTGTNSVAVGVKVDANCNLRLLCRPTETEDVEPISIPLVLENANGESGRCEFVLLDVVLVLDCSKSMKGEKLDCLKRGVIDFAYTANERGGNLGVVKLPAKGKNGGAKVLCPVPTSPDSVELEVQRLTAAGGTPLGQGLQAALDSFPAAEGNVRRYVVLFTDGMPANLNHATKIAKKLRKTCRLVVVGIGEDVNAPFLRSIASSPDDYDFAKCPADILGSFNRLSELLFDSEE